MEWENSLDTDAVRNLTHCESCAATAAINFDHDAFERLDAFLFACDNAHLQPQRVANPELGDILAQATFFDFPDDVIHGKPTPKQSGLQNYPKLGRNSMPRERIVQREKAKTHYGLWVYSHAPYSQLLRCENRRQPPPNLPLVRP